MFKKILQLIFPEGYSCICCKRDIFDTSNFFCATCEKELPFLTEKACLHCGEPLISDGNYCKRCKGKEFLCDRAIAPFKYSGKVKTLICELKDNKYEYIAKALAKYMAKTFVENKLYADLIMPVPLCNKRLRQRGFNQSALLANEVSKILKIPYCDNCLFRKKETPDQKELDYKERQTNLIDAFKVIKSKVIKDKSILLIDDIYTTGATTTECARMLKLKGAKTVYTLTAGHTVLVDITEEEDL